MFLSIAALLVAVADAPEAKKSDDPIVCRRDRSALTGTRLGAPSVCKPKSEWARKSGTAKRKPVEDNGAAPMIAAPAEMSPAQ